MRTTLIGIIMLATLATTGCENKSSDKASGTSSAVTAPGAKHAAVGVRPGSHADWCGEHQVPESMCTRCNPSLVAAFKATGDWCVEHNLPESQCLICNPELKIERPPLTGAAKP